MVMNTRKIPRLDEIYLDKSTISERIKDKKATRYDSPYNCKRKKEIRHRHTNNQNNSRDHSNDSDNDYSEEDDHLRNKSEIHKLAERVCGDWSEHVSRNGKRYFYNSRTEKSQWDRPKNWIDEFPISSSSKTPERNKNPIKKSKQYNDDSCHKSRTSDFSDARHKRDSERKVEPLIDKLFRDYSKKQTDDRINSRTDNSRTEKNNFGEYNADRNNSRGRGSRSGYSGRNHKNCQPHRNNKATPERSVERSRDVRHGRTTDRPDCNRRKMTTDLYDRTKSFSQSPRRSLSSVRIVSGGEEAEEVVGARQINGCMDEAPESDLCHKEVDNNLCEDMEISPTVSPSTGDPRKKPPASPSSLLKTPQLDGNSFLSSLQQFVLQPSCGGLGGEVEVGNEKISATQLAFLPILLTQLAVIQQKGCQAQNQRIIQQAIPLLLRLQEMLVAQQQQRQLQQRQLQQLQLQQLLLQLLKMQKNSKPVNQELDAESPYSPPDSDDTPSSSTANNKPAPIVTPTTSNAATSTPTMQDASVTPVLDAKRNLTSNSRSAHHESNTHYQSTSSCTTPLSTHPSPALRSSTPLFHNSTPTREATNLPSLGNTNSDEFRLSASLAKYADKQLIAHALHSPADEMDTRAERLHLEGHALTSVFISQLLIDLKRDRSHIRTQEILSTLTEQRVISIRQELFDVERLQTHSSVTHSDPIDF